MKEVLNSIKAGLLQRIESPLIGSFSILFVLFNWRAISIFLFSAKPIEERLSYIEQAYSQSCYYFWLPAAFALALTFVHPFVVLGITRYLIWIEEKKQKMRTDLRKKDLTEKIKLQELEAKSERMELDIEWAKLRNKARQTKIEGLGNVLNKATDTPLIIETARMLDIMTAKPDEK